MIYVINTSFWWDVCVCVCAHMHAHAHTHANCISVCVCTCMSKCVCVKECMRACVCMHACMTDGELSEHCFYWLKLQNTTLDPIYFECKHIAEALINIHYYYYSTKVNPGVPPHEAHSVYSTCTSQFRSGKTNWQNKHSLATAALTLLFTACDLAAHCRYLE